MAGGAGNIGSAGGMGNASAQPQGGPFGGSMGGGQQSGGGSPFGMQQQQQPMQNPFGGQQLGPNQSPGYGMNQFQQQQQMQNPNGPSQPTPMQMPQPGSQTPSWAGGYLGQQPMQNPFGQMGALSSPGYGANQQQQLGPNQSPGYGMNQFRQQQQMGQLGAANQMPEPMGQRPAFLDNPDFQAYQKQEQDLGRQMNEYMQKAPMYQQMQELQGKMRGFQQPQQGQMQNPYGNIDQMQQQRNMQDQARQQRMYEQATQDDMRAAVMPNQSGYQGQMGDTGFRAMPAVMPQQPDPGMMDALTLHSAETYGNQRMGGGFGRRGMGGGYGQQMPQQAMGLQGLYSMLQGRRGGPFGGY